METDMEKYIQALQFQILSLEQKVEDLSKPQNLKPLSTKLDITYVVSQTLIGYYETVDNLSKYSMLIEPCMATGDPVINFIRMVFFDDKYMCNHNVYITDIQRNKACYYDGIEWCTTPAKDLVNKLVCVVIDLFNEYVKSNRDVNTFRYLQWLSDSAQANGMSFGKGLELKVAQFMCDSKDISKPQPKRR